MKSFFIDDGSSDKSREMLAELCAQDSAVRVFHLARNFGQQAALSAGLDLAHGEAVIMMDADLQDSPETIPAFLEQWRNGCDVVYAVRTYRPESWWKRTGYFLFYRLLQVVADISIPLDSGDFCLMDRKVVEILRAMPERNRFLRGLRSWVGLKQVGVAAPRLHRHSGRPRYTVKKLMLLAFDGLLGFSLVPLRLISAGGLLVSIFSLAMGVYYAIYKMFYDLNPPGFATLVVLITFFAGVQLITVGLIGEYLGRVFIEVKRRPHYIIEGAMRGDANSDAQ